MKKLGIFSIITLFLFIVGNLYSQGVIESPTSKEITTTVPITVKQQSSTPSNPISGYNKIYTKSDGKMYKLNSSGTEEEVVGASSGNFTSDVTIGSATAGKNLTVYGTVTVNFATGVDAVIGRGTTDTDITYIALRSANGTKFYIYPDNSGALITSTTAP